MSSKRSLKMTLRNARRGSQRRAGGLYTSLKWKMNRKVRVFIPWGDLAFSWFWGGVDDTVTYQLTSHLSYAPSNVTSLALIKRTPTLDSLLPLSTQLHIFNLFGGDETPYESLHAVVSGGIKPWFDAFVGTRVDARDGDGKMGIPTTKKKLRSSSCRFFIFSRMSKSPKHALLFIPLFNVPLNR